jgi:hypothetical protein
MNIGHARRLKNPLHPTNYLYVDQENLLRQADKWPIFGVDFCVGVVRTSLGSLRLVLGLRAAETRKYRPRPRSRPLRNFLLRLSAWIYMSVTSKCSSGSTPRPHGSWTQFWHQNTRCKSTRWRGRAEIYLPTRQIRCGFLRR